MSKTEHKGLIERLPEKIKKTAFYTASASIAYTAWVKLLEFTLPAVNYSNTYRDLVPITQEMESEIAAASANDPYITAAILAIFGGVAYRKQIKSGLAKLDKKAGEVFDHLVEGSGSTKNYDSLVDAVRSG